MLEPATLYWTIPKMQSVTYPASNWSWPQDLVLSKTTYWSTSLARPYPSHESPLQIVHITWYYRPVYFDLCSSKWLMFKRVRIEWQWNKTAKVMMKVGLVWRVTWEVYFRRRERLLVFLFAVNSIPIEKKLSPNHWLSTWHRWRLRKVSKTWLINSLN